MKKHICVVAAGGTISHVLDPVTNVSIYGLRGADLIEQIALDGISLRAIDFSYPNGEISSINDILRLSEVVSGAFREGARSVVVTHGTDALEDVAYAMDELALGPGPTVFTGAMRPSWAPDSDGVDNLRSAVKLATFPFLLSGTFLVMGGTCFEAWDVFKGHTEALDAFRTWRGQGHDYMRVEDLGGDWKPTQWNRLCAVPPPMDLSVPILTLGAGDDSALLRPDVRQSELSLDGLVVASMGAGTIPPRTLDRLTGLSQTGIPIVCCSSSPHGPTMLRLCYPGAYEDIIAAGIIFEDVLSPRKARIRLIMSLALGRQYRRFEALPD